MEFPVFQLERNQTLFENTVPINLTESGVHPLCTADLLDGDDPAALLGLPLGYGHTDGTPALRRAVADWHPGADPANVVITHGTSEANLLALLSLAGPGDHVIVLAPNFLQLDGLCRGLGIEVTQVALRPDDGWQPDPDAIEAALRPHTRLITLCDPNNPTGLCLQPAARAALARLSDRHGVWLLIDEIYRGSEIDGPGSGAAVPPTAWGLGERIVVTGGLSKSFGAPGLRLGWCVAPEPQVRRMHERQDYTTIGTGALAQALAVRALSEPLRSRILARGRSILRRGRDTLGAWVAARPGWQMVRPQASGMGFVRYDMDIGSAALVEHLRQDTGVFLCAGAWFGTEGWLRIGFGVEHDQLTEGLARIETSLPITSTASR